MTTFGEFCLLVAMVGSGYAAFAASAARSGEPRILNGTGVWAMAAAVLALSVAMAVLCWALVAKDFRFAYVVEYSSRQLAWYYSLSACWVGQAGSLLLWAWLLGVLALAFRGARFQRAGHVENVPHNVAFAVVAAYLCFLVGIMVFAADPMEPSIASPKDGAGLDPLLQHPVMLIHPPIVFLGYACYAFPFAMAIAALLTGRIDADWPRQIRSWTLAAWAILGAGILLGADWAYEELGWGGYWSWDPVENSSLIPWLTGTALVHAALAWQHRGVLKKSTLLLAIATLGLCNFAAFVTRSGIFSSVHEFSRSPIGWMFLGLLAALAAGGAILVLLRRKMLRPDRPIASLWARESLILLSGTALVLLAVVTLLGTAAVPLSALVLGHSIVVGPAFYNAALIPLGLLLLGATALAPLSRWGSPPSRAQKVMFLLSGRAGLAAMVVAFTMGVRHPIPLGVAGLGAMAIAALILAEVRVPRLRSIIPSTANREEKSALEPGEHAPCDPRHPRRSVFQAVLEAVRDRRRARAAFLVHAGFVCLAVGVAGSSLGSMKYEADMSEGQSIDWAGRSIRFAGLIQRDLPDTAIVETRLDISQPAAAYSLFPAQHLHRSRQEWSTEVAIHSTWADDFYAIVHGGQAGGKVHLTFLINPLMRWLWLGGWIAGIGAILGLLPSTWPRLAEMRSRSRRDRPTCIVSARRGSCAA